MRLLVIYAYCTFGGVERVVLNRLEAFRNAGLDVRMDMVFLHDGGGFRSFNAYVKSFDLSRYITIHLVNGNLSRQFLLNEYDMVFDIDTPSVFEDLKNCENFFVECHTPYKENRGYLKTLPDYVKAILVPSKAFREEIRTETSRSVPIFVFPNSVSAIFFRNFDEGQNVVFFKKRPLAYMARLDELKNVEEALRIFAELKDRTDIMFMIIGKDATDEIFMKRLKAFGILGKTFIRSKMSFDDVPRFLSLLKNHKGIFLSPSKGESFGMAVAESIVSSVPVMVSDIPPHRDLLGSNEDFLYPLGNLQEARKRITNLLDHWDQYSRTMKEYAGPLDHSSFIKAWTAFVGSYPKPAARLRPKLFEQAVHKHFEKGLGSPMYETYINYALSTNDRGRAFARNLSEYVAVENKSYLDIGTAYGGCLVALARQGCRPYLGIEIDNQLIALGKLNLLENHLDPESIVKLDICDPLPDALKRTRFDLITCTDVLEHVLDLSKAFENIKSLMAEGGHLYLEVPNRYHVNNILSDPHFGLFGITLLNRDEAIRYCEAVRGCDFSVGEYYELEHLLSFFPGGHYEIRKLWNSEMNVREVDDIFLHKIEMTYPSRIHVLSIPLELKKVLERRFEDFIHRYKSQIVNRSIDSYYVQTWKLMITRK
jgi:glycosyltransferase involved in cell wall biosynthesis/2-polyprenyl-3-methyl-5-hydroxy-6-metoxy-1,4-benzoquinol methylase